MSVAFDAYHKWLGIPPTEQPPHHYRLLGIAVFEADADVIESAADQRMTHVRSFQTGKYSARSQSLLNELSAAKLCLLDAEQKASYDEGLRLRFDAAEPLHAVVPVAVEMLQPEVGIATVEPVPLFVADRPARVVRKSQGLSSRSLAWLILGVVGLPTVAWIGYLIVQAKAEREVAARKPAVPAVVEAPTPDKERQPITEPETPPVVEAPTPEQEQRTLPMPEGRYVRVELPRTGTLSLAEVEVYSGGRNIARSGTASQINTEYPASDAAVAIDGKVGSAPPSSTHTKHDVTGPWWEVDLGEAHRIERIVVYNRPDCCGDRLEGFTLNVLDADRHIVAKDFNDTRRWGVASLAFSPDGHLFATGQDDGTIRLWELPSRAEFTPLPLGSDAVSLAFGPMTFDKKRKPSGYVLAAGSSGGLVKTMDVTFAKDRTGTVSRSFTPTKVAFEGKDRVECVRFSPDGKLLAVTRHGGHINLYDWRTGQSTREMPFIGGDVTWIAFHPQQPWCVTAHRNERIACIWNYETKELLCELKGHTGGVLCAEFSPDGRHVATASEDYYVKLWELSGTLLPDPATKKPTRRKTNVPAPTVGE